MYPLSYILTQSTPTSVCDFLWKSLWECAWACCIQPLVFMRRWIKKWRLSTKEKVIKPNSQSQHTLWRYSIVIYCWCKILCLLKNASKMYPAVHGTLVKHNHNVPCGKWRTTTYTNLYLFIMKRCLFCLSVPYIVS